MLDRSVDLVSPFCTPQIYEGLLDEAFGISVNEMTVPTKILDPTMEDAGGFTELTLNNEEILFKEIRGMTIRDVGLTTNAK
jgi:hypothetical protein